jgi:hypothetical protein
MYTAACPFQEWYGEGLPDDFENWESLLVNKYVETWTAKGSPKGIRENDHNYGTVLGQGNTLGFVAARLTLSAVPDAYKHGLFAETGPLRAIVRFSDFGDDASSIRFGRMAVKVPLESAWGGEVNLLMTESMDSFPISNFGQLGAFAGKSKNKFDELRFGAALAKNTAHVVGVKAFGAVVKGDAFEEQLLAKNFYSQLPYQLGDKAAMKFSFIHKQETCGEPGASPECCVSPTEKMSEGYAANRSGATASFLEHCDAHFDLQLQVKAFSRMNDDTIFHRGHESWPEEPVTVGSLVIPMQQSAADTAVSTELRSALSSELGVEPDGIDKMFAFHPVSTHEDNRPIGDINIFRSGFYSQHAAIRFETIEDGMLKDDGGHGLSTVKQMPFTKLSSALFGM